MKSINLSNKFGKLTPEFILYNGSVLPINNTDMYYCAYRATAKPNLNQTIETFPYQTANGKYWFNSNNFIGIVKYDKNYNILNFQKYIEQNSRGNEDPRLYYRDDKIYINYNGFIPKGIAGCKSEEKCVGMFEAELNDNFFTSGTLDTKLICSKIYSPGDPNAKDLFDKYPTRVVKNWSYVPRYFFIDALNSDTKEYSFKNNDPSICYEKIDTALVKLQEFLNQKDWKIALTTASVIHNNEVYGAAHIRIPWISMYNNFDSLSPELQRIIIKNDIHHPDWYMVSIYKMDRQGGDKKLSNPFIITGDTSDEYYSYNIMFPCGFYIKKNSYYLTYGLGDCLLGLAKENLSDLIFHDKLDYKDLKYYKADDSFNSDIKKSVINRSLCINGLESLLLPHLILLFDLGGTGLKLSLYDSIKSKYTDIPVKDNTISDIKQTPRQYIRNQFPEFDKFLAGGNGFGMSLAGVEKLWNKSIRKQIQKIEPMYLKTPIDELFGIRNNSKLLKLGDYDSHLYGVLSTLSIEDRRKKILNIAIGSGINVAYSDGRTIIEKVTTDNNFWDLNININGTLKKVRNAFIEATKEELNIIIQQVLGSLKIEPPNIICFTGGGTQYHFITQLGLTPFPYRYTQPGEVGEVIFYADKNIMFQGLVFKIKLNTCG
jgi:hypothetical protein